MFQKKLLSNKKVFYLFKNIFIHLTCTHAYTIRFGSILSLLGFKQEFKSKYSDGLYSIC